MDRLPLAILHRFPLTVGTLDVAFSPHLPKPKLERERFSGGVNESARQRNEERKRECSSVFLIDERTLVVPKWLQPEFEKLLEEVARG